jgi:hypothetical protein
MTSRAALRRTSAEACSAGILSCWKTAIGTARAGLIRCLPDFCVLRGFGGEARR